MLSKDDVMAALAAIPGPDGKTPLPQSGAIDGVTIRDGKVFLAIKVDPARAQAMEAMRSQVEARIKALARRRLGARHADRGGARRAPRAPRRPRKPRVPPPAAAGRSRASRRSSRSPPARAGSASRPPPAISPSGLSRLGLARRRARRRPVRSVDAAPVRHHGKADARARRQGAHPDHASSASR